MFYLLDKDLCVTIKSGFLFLVTTQKTATLNPHSESGPCTLMLTYDGGCSLSVCLAALIKSCIKNKKPSTHTGKFIKLHTFGM